MSDSELWLEGLSVGPFQENCYFLRHPDRPETIIIDPGDEAPRLKSFIERHAFEPVAIINTHAHLDHIGAVAELKEEYHIPFHLHPEDRPILSSAPQAARLYGVRVPRVPEVDSLLSHGQQIDLGGLSISVRHVPGHTPGHVCLLVGNVVVAGDVLFQGSIGRTDLPGGDTETLLASIARELLILPDDTLVYPGHGPSTTIGRERRLNPFLSGLIPE